MKITAESTHLVGNAWKHWLFVRVDTDEGILRDAYIGLAAAVSAVGDVTGLPDRVELDRLLATSGRDVIR